MIESVKQFLGRRRKRQNKSLELIASKLHIIKY